ncbi:polyadenylate-binding protein-interacting protein 5-like [Magnolia sinica]|uniref:polyadenylate-binding protein-interacting protein 5-like n=1 Tax=Magnolia sinica TaxID=86752 RepID=UPI002659D691|nr:polyadenylate-binding protein-interacting protein 5-like [Magnolia sinica]XP_058111677.1 polyadenylate-binding protein-interacting protein 5-like [Magnolia sinica]
MKPGKSSLNPYAASFVPLSRRGINDENKAHITTYRDHKSDGGTEIFNANKVENNTPQTMSGESKNPMETAQNAQKSNILGTEEDWSQKGHNFYSFEDSMPRDMNDRTEKENPAEDYEVDMAYLAAAFPGISEQSLVDVYFANQGDLEASIEMLIQLEGQPDDFQRLPQTLNIGDVSDSGVVGNTSGEWRANYGEASGSSGPSDSVLGPVGN